jgi:flagella basal body P-ring formation protein FlgA
MILGVALAAAACLPVQADRIYARDIARAVPAFARVPPDLALSYAPRPGLERVFHPAELAQTLQRHGVREPVASRICFAWPMKPLTIDAVRSAIAREWVEVIAISEHTVPEGTLRFPPASLKRSAVGDTALWKGYVEYLPGKRFEVWARVRASASFARVVITEMVRSGERVDASKVRIESLTGFPGAGEFLSSLDDAEGKVARRYLPVGTRLRTTDVAPAPVVVKGETVHVRAVRGAASVGFEGTARDSAGVGAIVAVLNPNTRKTVRATVTGPGAAVLVVE